LTGGYVYRTNESMACSWNNRQPIHVCKGEQLGGKMGVKLPMYLTLARTKDSAGARAPVAHRVSFFCTFKNHEISISVKKIS